MKKLRLKLKTRLTLRELFALWVCKGTRRLLRLLGRGGTSYV
ncbi:MAG: hypothetical protein ACOX7I_03725 [Oscillospiraceae bacterium]